MNNLLQNKSVKIALGIGIFILIFVIILSPKKNVNPAGSAQQIDSQAPKTERPELIDLAANKRQQAAAYVSSIKDKLPIYLESFPTSADITTTINLYRLSDDPSEVVRLEIYGLSYINIDSDETKNPNVTAYKESYLKAIELLESKNIDPKKLIFIYGDIEYVRKTTEAWIDALKLHP